MATTTTNFGFDVPTSSDLVKNGATAISTLGQDIDTFLAGSPNKTAGKNVLINADFRVNQRTTGVVTTSTSMVVDRFSLNYSGGTCSGEQKTFTAGAGITGLALVKNYLEFISSGQSGTSDQLRCRGAFEDVYTYAGETVTFSFYAKSASGTPKIALGITQNFGSGGSVSATAKMGEVTLSTSWTRYSITFTMPSISGKTIGAGNYNTIQFWMSAGTSVDGGIWGIGVQNNTFQFTAFQLESGATATPFQTATGTLQGELAACKYYYKRITGGSGTGSFTNFGTASSTTQVTTTYADTSPMRVTPTAVEYANVAVSDINNARINASSVALDTTFSTSSTFVLNLAVTGATQYRPYTTLSQTGLTGYIGLSAEL